MIKVIYVSNWKVYDMKLPTVLIKYRPDLRKYYLQTMFIAPTPNDSAYAYSTTKRRKN